jgi:hypothetical protein
MFRDKLTNPSMACLLPEFVAADLMNIGYFGLFNIGWWYEKM